MSIKRIAYDFIPETIVGSVWMAATNKGLICVDFDMTEVEFIKCVRGEFRVLFEEDKSKVHPFADQINSYLEGNLTSFDLDVDLSNCSLFQRKVLQSVKEVPYGQTTTYGDIAKDLGDPNAMRAVGQALRRNPVPIAIPCHRVLNADGTIGGYGGVMGVDRKIELLKLEGVILA